MPVITIFGSGKCVPGGDKYISALMSGDLLAKQGFDIVTGGYKGVMEAALKGASNHQTKRIAVINEMYQQKANQYANEIIKTNSYIDRLKKLIEIGDAYLILPGGTGTLLELTAVWALKDKEQIADKPIITYGEQWTQVLETMSFYSERLLEKADMVETAETLEDAVNMIINSIK